MVTQKKDKTIAVVDLKRGIIDVCILGLTPIILNRVSEKAKRELLFPSKKKTGAARAQSLKHNPREEFVNSPYLLGPDSPTLLAHLPEAFKAAIRGAGVDMPGTSKAQLGRCLWVEGLRIPLYGLPELIMSVVRSSDINHTPDIRTRCIIPQWACHLTLNFAEPILTAKMVASYLAAAGMTQGIGDWRPEKGSGTHGQFKIVDKDDKQFLKIIKMGGYAAQVEAMNDPIMFDRDSEDLLQHFDDTIEERGTDAPVVPKIEDLIHTKRGKKK